MASLDLERQFQNALAECERLRRVYDYADSNIAMLVRMYEKRLKKYRAIGYVVE